MRTSAVLLALLVAAPLAGAYHDYDTPNIVPDFDWGWPTPGEPMEIFVLVFDDAWAGVPPMDVVLEMDGVVFSTHRTPAFDSYYVYSVLWTATPGPHTFRIIADASNEIAESHEDDNEWTYHFLVTDDRPDLSVENFVATLADGGKGADLTLDLCNRGTVAGRLPQPGYVTVDYTWIEFKLGTSDRWTHFTTATTPTLAPGECASLSATWGERYDVILGRVEFRASAPCREWCGDINPTNDAAESGVNFLLGEHGVPGVAHRAPVRPPV